MNAADVSSSTRPLMSRNIAVSFRWIGQSRNVMLAARRRDDLCRAEQLGAERQPRRLGGFEVHAQVDLAFVEGKPNDSPGAVPVVGVADGEDRPALERGNDVIQPLRLGLADEEDMTALYLFHPAITLDPEAPSPDLLAPY